MRLLEQGADVDLPEADGTTALHWAARSDDTELVDLLLGAGANASAANRYGVTALNLAATNGNGAITQALLRAGADPNAVLPEGETLLMTAARTGDPDVVRAILDRGVRVNAREQWFGETALVWAAAENHAEVVDLLIERGAEINGRSDFQEFEQRRSGQSILSLGEWTPLMYAARENALDSGAALAANGADLDLVDPDGATALVIAIINAHYDFAAILLEAGADPNVVDNDAGMGPLYAAVDMHSLAVGHGRPNPRPTSLIDSVEIVRLLLQYGAEPDARLHDRMMQRHHTGGDGSLGEGATPFMRASKSGAVELMQLLLASGADATLAMPNQSTALMYASGLGWRNGSPAAPSYDQGTDAEAVEAISLLLDLGLNLNGVNQSGDTALHVAAVGRASEDIVAFLIEQGADLTLRNMRDQTPLEAAESRNKEAIAMLLREAMGLDAPATELLPQ